MLHTQTNFRPFGSSLEPALAQIQPKKKFTLDELVAQCDLSAPMPQDLLDWQNMPPAGQELPDVSFNQLGSTLTAPITQSVIVLNQRKMQNLAVRGSKLAERAPSDIAEDMAKLQAVVA